MHGKASSRLLLQAAATGGLAAAGIGTASAAEVGLGPAEQQAAPASLELIDNSRLGCGQSVPMWSAASAGGTQCPFDSATRGARVSARQDYGKGTIEAYATVAHATDGALIPDQLLAAPGQRFAEAIDLFLVGIKGSAFDDRLKVTTEFVRTSRIVDDLLGRDWALADQSRDGGTSTSVRLDARLVSTPRFSWSLTGRYRSVSEDYSVGRSPDLARYFATPGTLLALSSSAKLGAVRLTAGVEQRRTSYVESASRRAGLDYDFIALRWVSRDTRLEPAEGSALLESRTHTDSAFVDLDFHMLAASLLPDLGELPFVVPSTLSLSYRSGETESRTDAATERYRRSSFGIDGLWETPLGETTLSYWRNQRLGLTAGALSRSTEMAQAAHFVRRGNWRFGLDAALTRTRGEGSNSYDDRSWSFGQSVAYSTPDGPEFSLQLGQDRGSMRMADDSFASSDSYSSVTASLDLSRYLQKRFERPDLRLTLDYRRALEHSDSETILSDELIDRWSDDFRREGLLLSFGMKL